MIDSLKKLDQTPQIRAVSKHLKLITTEPNISTAQLHTIKSPTLLMGGDHEVVLPEHTLSIGQAIPNSYTWIVPNSGHSIPIFKKNLVILRLTISSEVLYGNLKGWIYLTSKYAE